MTKNHEFATATFDPKTRTFHVKSPRGEYPNAKSVGAFENYREMDMYVWGLQAEGEAEGGILAYLSNAPLDEFIFYYPDRGDVMLKCENPEAYAT